MRFRALIHALSIGVVSAAFACSQSAAPHTIKAAAKVSTPVAADASGAEVSQGCGVYVVGGGSPVPMDEVDPELGVSPAAIAAQLEGTHLIPIDWHPWWSAEPIAAGPLGDFSIEVHALGTARKQSSLFEIDATLRLHDARGVLAREQPVIFQAALGGVAWFTLNFDDVDLARRLGLPPSADPAQTSDPFYLSVSLTKGKVSAALGSVRVGMNCALAAERRTPAFCEKYYGLLSMGDEAITQPRALRASLVPGFTPADALTHLQAQGPLEVVWGDAAPSRLHVKYEAVGDACVTAGEVAINTAPDEYASVPGYKVVIPFTATLHTEDGRLHTDMTGFAETLISDRLPWDRRVAAAFDSKPFALIEQAGGRPGFVVPEGATAILGVWLRAPFEGDSERPNISMGVCRPYPNTPDYPLIADDLAPNRKTCVCASQAGSQEALVRVRP